MANKVFDALDKTFETKKTELEATRAPTVPVDPPAGNLESDFEEARMALKRSMSYNEEAIQGILSIAQNSDNPRAFEVAGQLIKSMAEGAKDIMGVQEKKKKIDKLDGKASGSGVTNNNLFVGSTSELLKMINKEQEKTVEHEKTIEHDSE
jgi:hypothetical protein